MMNEISLPPHVVRFLDNMEQSAQSLKALELIATRNQKRPAVLPRLICMFAVLFLVAKCSAAQAEDTRSFYDRNGSFAGSSSTNGRNTSVQDRNGSFSGSVIRNSNGTSSFYDRNGHFTGSSVDRRKHGKEF